MSPARRLLPVLALTLAVGLLAGCFRSDAPLIDKAQAAFPFEELTVKTEDSETAILRKDGDAYVFVDPDKAAAGNAPSEPPILLHQAGEQLYVLQETGENGRSVYLFAKRDGDRIIVSSICRAIEDAVLAKVGLERESDGGELADCVAKDLKSLTELAKMPELWTNETKTLEIVSIK